MTVTNAEQAAAIVADPQWFAHRYDVQRDELHFQWMSREDHRRISFLSDPDASGSRPRQVVPRALIADLRIQQGPLHLILHSGLCGSTLLARALDQDGVVMALKEPPILTDLVSHRLKRAPHVRQEQLLDLVAALLARPLSPGESVVLKMSSVGNLFGPEILARRPASRALCQHAPLPVFLTSLARRGLAGRISARKLFIGLSNSGMADLGFTDKELMEQSDLQLGADAWLAIHRIIGEVAARYGPSRARSAVSEQLISDPARLLAALSRHFELPLDVSAIVTGPVFQSHSKRGEVFDRERREDELRAAEAVHGEEIEAIGGWARKVAEALGIGWDLPHPLIDR